MKINFGGFRTMKKQLVVIGVLLFLCLSILSGCSEQKKPNISFEGIPLQIEQGQTTQLRWNVSDATSVTIDNEIGTVNLTGNLTILPLETTTYILTAKSSSTTVTATVQIIVNESNERPNVSMVQTEFYIEIIGMTKSYVNQTKVVVTATNKASGENQTSALEPTIIDGNGFPKFLGIGDVITFSHLADFQVGDTWTIQLLYKGEIIGQCIFRNPKGPYNISLVRMLQNGSAVRIIAIINGPVDQTLCSIDARNASSGVNQTMAMGATITDGDKNPNSLMVGDQITFSNLGKFKKGDQWTIQLEYEGAIIGQCIFTKQGNIIIIPK